MKRVTWFVASVLAVAVAAAALVFQTSCAPAGSDSAKPAAPGKRLKFIFVCTCVNEAFFNPVKKGVRDAAKLVDVDTEYVGTEDVDLKAQAAMVAKAVADGYDGIAVDLVDTKAFDEVVADAIAKGVPVVAFNTDDTTPNARLSTVSQDVYRAGLKVGETAAPLIPDKSRILMTMHSENCSPLDDRLRGEQEVLAKKGVTWKVVITGTDPEKCCEVITKALKENPDIKFVLGTGQADTEGAGLAIERNFKGGGYACAGFDLSPEILRLIKAGHIKFTTDQQPYIQGFYPVIQLALYVRHGIRPSNIDSGATLIRAEDVDKVIPQSQAGYR